MNTDNPYGNRDDAPSTSWEVEGLDEVDGKFRVPPELFYEVTILSVDDKPSKSQNEMLTLTYMITGRTMSRKGLPAFDGQADTHSGKEIRDYLVKSKAAAWRWLAFANAFRLDVVKGRICFNPAELVGLRCVAQFKDEDYEGRTSSKVLALLVHPEGSRG